MHFGESLPDGPYSPVSASTRPESTASLSAA